MGIHDVVARLNKSAGVESPLEIKKIPNKPNNTVVINKTFPPSPITSPTGLQKHKPRSPPTEPISKPVSHPTAKPATQSPKPIIKHTEIDIHAFNSTTTEILDLYHDLLQQYNNSQEYIKKLESDVETYFSEATKVRDYEIRVEYLAQKLEQVSEEKDYFQRELKQMNQSAPLSPAFSQEQLDRNHTNDNFLADLVHVYEEMPENMSENMDGMIFPDKNEMDKEIQTMIAKYVNEIGIKRLEAKTLQEVVRRQDELIDKLETKLNDNADQLLLKEQVEVQQNELENKRELLSQLINEREELLRKVDANHRRRSSIEMLTDKISRLNRRSSVSSSSSSSGRGSPPLTAPPRQPLPPLPSHDRH